MQKKGVLIWAFILQALVLTAVAQVPLYLEPTDTIPHAVDSIFKHGSKAKPHKGLTAEKIAATTKIDSLINYANTYLGDRYRRGGTGAVGFDCSGFTMVVFKQMGIKLPHTSAGQGLMGVQVTKNNIQKGDLVLFRGRSRRSSRIGHVGIVISEKGEPIKFIHSSTSQGVRVDAMQTPYYTNRFVKAVRITELYK